MAVEGIPGASTGPSAILPFLFPQGEAGRNGAPGEKGPNGLPVSVGRGSSSRVSPPAPATLGYPPTPTWASLTPALCLQGLPGRAGVKGEKGELVREHLVGGSGGGPGGGHL